MHRSAPLGVFLAAAFGTNALGQYAITWHELTCGGATAPIGAGLYTLQFSIGAPVPGAPVAAGPYSVSTGFLAAAGGAPPCYPNCDSSTTPPVLNVLDFSCFLNQFAAGDLRANCDGSTTPPVLNVLDFSCFLNRFAAGCS